MFEWLTFRRPQRRSPSESSEEYPSGSPIYVSRLFGYVIGKLCVVKLRLHIAINWADFVSW